MLINSNAVHKTPPSGVTPNFEQSPSTNKIDQEIQAMTDERGKKITPTQKHVTGKQETTWGAGPAPDK